MSLYGALFSGVSGLAAQSSAMGAISDNISNVNTIGYKGTQVNFQTLVTHQVSATEYSPGGVQSKPRAGIDVQGLLQSTNSSTDISLSGQGFFVVNSVSQPGGTAGGSYGYTRAGSFKADKDGYLQNASGFYLQGWPLTATDHNPAAVPGEVTINGNTYMKAYKQANGNYHYVNQNIVSPTEMQSFNINTIGGTASASSSISMGANLPSGDPIYDPNNTQAGGKHDTNVLVYDSLGNTHNAQFSWTKTGSNDWSLHVVPPSGSATAVVTNYSTANTPPSLVYGAAGQVEFNQLPPVNSYFKINGIKIQFYNSGAGGTDPSSDAAGGIIGVDENNIGTTDTTTLVTRIQNAISAVAADPITNPNRAPLLLGGLADGASRFVADAGVLRINQEPGAAAVSLDCTSNTTTLIGNSIVQSGTSQGSGGTPVFSVPAIYSGYVSQTPQTPITYSMVTAPPAAATLKIGTINTTWGAIKAAIQAGTAINGYTFAAGATPPTTAQYAAGVAGYINSVAAAQGYQVTASSTNSTFTIIPSTVVSPATPAPTPILLDGGGLATDITTSATGVSPLTVQLFGESGTYSSTTGNAVVFNGDGTPASIIPNTMQITWANGAEDQTVNAGSSTLKPWLNLNFGNVNQSNGLTQLGGAYQVNYLTQNGAKFGNFSGVSIGADGIVTALFDNGVRSPVFQVPIATFANPDGMSALTGNVWIDTTNSGAYTIRHPGEAGSGQVQASSLESSTVDLGTEFTTMITVQRAYSASAKIITTADQMLDDLINIKR